MINSATEEKAEKSRIASNLAFEYRLKSDSFFIECEKIPNFFSRNLFGKFDHWKSPNLYWLIKITFINVLIDLMKRWIINSLNFSKSSHRLVLKVTITIESLISWGPKGIEESKSSN